jgi:hypothetical protein
MPQEGTTKDENETGHPHPFPPPSEGEGEGGGWFICVLNWIKNNMVTRIGQHDLTVHHSRFTKAIREKSFLDNFTHCNLSWPTSNP